MVVCTLFLLGKEAQKKKLGKKKHAALRGVAPAPYNLLKKVDENFLAGGML